MAKTVTSTCPNCQHVARIDPEWIGQRVRCSTCQHRYVIESFSVPSDDGSIASVSRTNTSKSDSNHSNVGETASKQKSPTVTTRVDSRAKRVSAEPTIGQLGRFELKAALGQGAFGRVYRAFDPQLGRPVALKVPRFKAEEKAKVRRFLGEARAAALLRHPHIVAVFESGEADGQMYIAYQLIDGQTLSSKIQQERVDFRKAAGWIADAADAMDYAHREGVLHRDVKSENMMVDQQDRLQIMDFGLAKRLDDDSSATMDGSLMGTPAYMSPEQARGEVAMIGPSSDQYSLGVILFELLTGQRPFSGPVHSVISQVISKESPSPQSLDASIPADLAAICLRAMEKDPSRRYPSASEMADDLRRWMRGEETIVRPATWIERGTRWCRRNPVVTLLSAAAMVLSLVATIGWGQAALSRQREAIQLRRVEEERKVAEEQRTIANEQSRLAEQQRKIAESKEAQALQSEATAKASERTAIDRLAESYFERGRTQCEFGDVGRGLLWMTLGLRRLTSGNPRVESVIRTNLTAWRSELCELEMVSEDTGGIRTICSPDGKTCFTGTTRGSVDIWNLTSGERIGEPLPHPGLAVKSLAISSDGTMLLSGCSDGSIRIWDVESRTVTGQMQQTGSVRDIAISPDKKLFITGSDDRVARLWDVSRREIIGEPLAEPDGVRGVPVMAVAFSPNGQQVAIGSRTAQIWDVSTRQRIGPAMPHIYRVSSLAFAPDGKTLFTGSWDHHLRRWRIPEGELIGDAIRLDEACSGVAVSPDGKHIAVAGDVGMVRIVKALSGIVIGQRLEHGGPVDGISWSHKGSHLIVNSRTGSTLLWKIPSSQPSRIAGPLTQPSHYEITALAISSDGTRLACGGESGEIDVWNLQSKKWEYSLGLSPQPGHRTVELQFQSGGDLFLASKLKAPIQFWNLKTLDTQNSLPWKTSAPGRAQFNSDGSRVFTASLDGQLRLIETATWTPINEQINSEPGLFAAALSPDEKVIAVGKEDGTVKLIERLTGKMSDSSEIRHGKPLYKVLFSPDSAHLLTFGFDGAVRFWSVASSLPAPGPALQHQGLIPSVAFSNDGKLIATASDDRTVRFWDSITHTPIGPPLRHEGGVYAIAFHPNGKELFSAGIFAADACCSWRVPEVMTGTADDIAVQFEKLVGLSFRDDQSMVPLTPKEWYEHNTRDELPTLPRSE